MVEWLSLAIVILIVVIFILVMVLSSAYSVISLFRSVNEILNSRIEEEKKLNLRWREEYVELQKKVKRGERTDA